MQRKAFLTMGVAGLAAAACHGVYAQGNVLRIGLTPVILADQAAFFSLWGRYLSRRLGSPVEFVARESYQEVLGLLFARQLDAVWICGYPYVQNQMRLKLLAVPRYEDRPTYQAYLIRPRQKDAVVRGWADLKGKILAYSDPLSNSGWLVAQTQLRVAGLQPNDLKKSFFAHSHRNVAEAVSARLAHAGSIDGYVWDTMRKQGMAAVEQTEVIWKSESFGFPPIVTRMTEQHPQTQALQSILLGMQSEPEGEGLLKALNLTGFEAGTPSLYSSIAQMLAVLKDRSR